MNERHPNQSPPEMEKPFAQCRNGLRACITECPDWDPEWIEWRELSANTSPYAVAMLAANPDKIYWSELSRNSCSDAIALLAANPDKIHRRLLLANTNTKAFALWSRASEYTIFSIPQFDYVYPKELSANCNFRAIQFLQKYEFEPFEYLLSANPSTLALQWLRERPASIDWRMLSRNPHPIAVELLRENPDRISWEGLSQNSSDWALELLRANPHRINWYDLSANKHRLAVQLLREHPASIDWERFCDNPTPDMFELIYSHRGYTGMINTRGLWRNPHIFVDEYRAIARRYFRDHIAWEIIAWVWHPSHAHLFAGLGFDADL